MIAMFSKWGGGHNAEFWGTCAWGAWESGAPAWATTARNHHPEEHHPKETHKNEPQPVEVHLVKLQPDELKHQNPPACQTRRRDAPACGAPAWRASQSSPETLNTFVWFRTPSTPKILHFKPFTTHQVHFIDELTKTTLSYLHWVQFFYNNWVL